MALSAPLQSAKVTGTSLTLQWSVIGKIAAAYTISVDDRPIAKSVRGSENHLDLSRLSAGKHRVRAAQSFAR